MYWLTLTYSDEYLPMNEQNEPIFWKPHCRSFFEILRKKYSKECKFKHFLVSEYGDNTIRSHYHCLLFVYMLGESNLKQRYDLRKRILVTIKEQAWPYGFAYNKEWHGGVFSYLTKYCCKPEMLGEPVADKTFTLISPGIGLAYLDNLNVEYREQNLDFTCVFNGKKMTLPRYYMDKIAPSRVPSLMAKDREKFDRLPLAEQERRKRNRYAKEARNMEREAQECETRQKNIQEYARTHSGRSASWYDNERAKVEQATNAYVRKQQLRKTKIY